MVKTHRRTRMRTKKLRTKKLRTKKRKGGAPTPAQIAWAAKGYRDGKKRPPPLKIGKTPSPTDKTKYVYNPETPSHINRLCNGNSIRALSSSILPKTACKGFNFLMVSVTNKSPISPACQTSSAKLTYFKIVSSI